jgi:hypothetical protein
MPPASISGPNNGFLKTPIYIQPVLQYGQTAISTLCSCRWGSLQPNAIPTVTYLRRPKDRSPETLLAAQVGREFTGYQAENKNKLPVHFSLMLQAFRDTERDKQKYVSEFSDFFRTA